MDKKRQKLNIRERKLIKGLMAGLTQSEAMRQAGYAEATVRSKSSQKVAEVTPTILEICERQGLTDDKLCDTVRLGLDADKVISAMVIAKDGEGMSDAHAMTKDFVEVPDWQSRLKAADIGLKLKGHMKDKTEVTGKDGAPIEHKITVEFLK